MIPSIGSVSELKNGKEKKRGLSGRLNRHWPAWFSVGELPRNE